MAGWKRDAEPNPAWWGYKKTANGGSDQNNGKRGVNDANKDGVNGGDDQDVEYIYLPKGMDPNDLAKMLTDAQEAEKKAKEGQAKQDGTDGQGKA